MQRMLMVIALVGTTTTTAAAEDAARGLSVDQIWTGDQTGINQIIPRRTLLLNGTHAGNALSDYTPRGHDLNGTLSADDP
ncbi:hypothetical protein, partial [Loktanella salsilacus]|uniref:hypothetical protein n=1 Tax=Loktanella salsilacus TaxID=195913 RepID=UPI0035651965